MNEKPNAGLGIGRIAPFGGQDAIGRPHRLLREEIVHRLGELIVDGQLTPGEKLPSERELATRLGVSRTVVRDALGVLIERGLVEVRPGRGTYVANNSVPAAATFLRLLVRRDQVSLAELIESRHVLEEQVARLAADRKAAEDLDALDRALAAMIDNQRRPFAFVEADVAFHEALARAAKNRLLVSFLNCIRTALSEAMLVGTSVRGAIETSIAEHQAILDAVRAGDSVAACQAMRVHLTTSYRQLVAAGYLESDSR